jgi:hypothetical protein
MGIGRAAKLAAQGVKILDKTIEVGGKSIKTRELIEQMLKSNRSQADISRALKEAKVPFDDTWLKNQITSMKARNPVLKPDKRMRDWEASWYVEKGINEGKTWDQIGEDLRTAGFKDGLKRAEWAREQYYKRLEQNSPANVPPAVIDNGESGPMAPEEQEPVFRPFDPRSVYRKPTTLEEELADAEQVLADNKKTDEEWRAEFQEAANEGRRQFEERLKALRERAEAEVDADPRITEMVEMIRSMKAMPSGARIMQAQGPTNTDPEATRMPQNLDDPNWLNKPEDKD